MVGLSVRITLPVVLLAMLYFGAIGWRLLVTHRLQTDMSQANGRIAWATQLTFRLNRLDSHIKSVLLMYSQRQNARDLEEISLHTEEFRQVVQQLKSRLSSGHEQRLLTLLEEAWNGQSAIIHTYLEAVRSQDKTRERLALLQWNAKTEMLDALQQDIIGYVRRLMDKSLDDLHRFHDQFKFQAAGLVVMALLLLVATLRFQRDRIIVPLQELTHAADETSKGGRNQRIQVVGGDEIAQLAEAFNRMTDRLLAANERLEEKVKERTSEVEQAFIEIRRTADELQVANRELENFNFAASHDLQEPLRIIQNHVASLEADFGDVLTETAREDLRFIQESATRMRCLILDLAAYAQGRGLPLDWRQVDLNATMDEVMRRLEGPIQSTGAQLLRGSLPVVQGDVRLLTTVLQQLVDNALKFHQPERPPVVTVSGSETDAGWEFRVADQGLGIEMRHRELIFVPFKRLNRRQDYEGSGLGLSVVREVVRRHGGEVRIEGEPGAGSVFIVTLPRKDGSSGHRPAMAGHQR
ncbi:MAG: HAMP domain-containing protein [Magnetococcales bacterium]|nr:HAMP domain-containing protein [Magnetococcales bacterium]